MDLKDEALNQLEVDVCPPTCNVGFFLQSQTWREEERVDYFHSLDQKGGEVSAFLLAVHKEKLHAFSQTATSTKKNRVEFSCIRNITTRKC